MWRELMPGLPASHAVFRGHFPGRPIVPGVMLLDALLHEQAADAGCTIVAAKFLHPVGPEQALQYRVSETGPDRMRCELRAAGRDIAIISLRRPPSPA